MKNKGSHNDGNNDNNNNLCCCRYRGVAALFNHSCCGANIKIRKLVANNTDKREPIHGFFALKKIVVREVSQCCLQQSVIWQQNESRNLLLGSVDIFDPSSQPKPRVGGGQRPVFVLCPV